MPLEEDLAEDNTSSPAASNTQVPQATATAAEEDVKCPICLDTISNEASIGICGHIFCFNCILEWSRISAMCPICRQPFHHLYHKVGPSNYEVYHIVQDTRRAARRRSRPHSGERRRSHSSSRQHHSSSSGDDSSSSRDHSSSSRDHSSSGGDHSSSSGDHSSSSGDHSAGRAGSPERGRSRSRRQYHDGHSRAHRDSLNSGRRQQSRAQDTAGGTPREEDPAPGPERDVPTSSGRSEPRQWGGWVSSREWQATWNRFHWRSRSVHRRRQREYQRRRGHRHATRSRSQQRSRRAW